MNSESTLQGYGLRLWRIGISLLLIGLVLYNPFVARSESSDDLSYQRLACNRATVGSAELQIFSIVPNPDIQTSDMDADVPQIEPTAILQAQGPALDQKELILVEPEVLAGVWFRPPPTP